MKLAIALVLTGCLADDPDLSETTSDITVGPDQGTFQGGGTPITLGTLASETCFIQGVAGQLAGSGAKGHPTGEVNIYPDTIGGHWKVLTTVAAQITVGCVAVPWANHEFVIGGSYTGTANTHCFMREVQGTGLTTSSTIITLASHPSGSTVLWDFAGTSVTTSPNAPTKGTATCFDYPATGGWGYTFYAPATTTDVYLLRDYYPSGPQVKSASTACGITGMIGDWSATGYPSHGMTLDTSTGSWTMNVGYGLGANVACVR